MGRADGGANKDGGSMGRAGDAHLGSSAHASHRGARHTHTSHHGARHADARDAGMVFGCAKVSVAATIGPALGTLRSGFIQSAARVAISCGLVN